MAVSRVSTKFRPLEFRVFRARPFGDGVRVLAAVSGGRDSMALLQLLIRLQPRWKFELEVAHVHHGKSKSKTTREFRDRAEKKVTEFSLKAGVPVSTLRLHDVGDSEEAMRDARLAALEKHAALTDAVIAMGHHADDLFETRLIRLLRGTGPQGLRAMTEFGTTANGRALWRPLLKSSKAEIELYLKDSGFHKNRDWLEDPSNRDVRFLRNEIRRNLIPVIEKTRPGSVASMARSLELISDFIDAGSFNANSSAGLELDRSELLNLNPVQRKTRLSSWLKHLGVKGISQSQIEEALKRIDTPRKRLTFEIGGRVWTVGSSIRIDTIG